MSVLLLQPEENLLESHPWKLPLHILWREPPSQADYPPGTSYKTRPRELPTPSRPKRSLCPLSVDGDSLCLAPNLVPLDQPETPPSPRAQPVQGEALLACDPMWGCGFLLLMGWEGKGHCHHECQGSAIWCSSTFRRTGLAAAVPASGPSRTGTGAGG